MRPLGAGARPGIGRRGLSHPTVGGPTGSIRLAALLAVVLLAVAWLPAAAQDASATAPVTAPPVIVVTTEVLGAVVRDLAADEAEVVVLMQGGADPHTWQPSARDVERIFAADLVVANGLSLEEGLVDVLERAEAEGVPVFRAADHVTVRYLDEGDAAQGADSGTAHGLADPHFWTDPLAMRDVVVALTAQLAAGGLDASAAAEDLAARLMALDGEVRQILDAVPPDRRKLATGHDSLGYLADRYGFTVVGTVIPGLTTQSEVSARELAQLVDTIRAQGVDAVFTEVGTPTSVADAVAAETGARLVDLQIVQLPEDGSYFTLIRDLARAIAGALGG
jgi:zinc/manganese transport system substrate-binding protein